jgi:hypothetical protein
MAHKANCLVAQDNALQKTPHLLNQQVDRHNKDCRHYYPFNNTHRLPYCAYTSTGTEQTQITHKRIAFRMDELVQELFRNSF